MNRFIIVGQNYADIDTEVGFYNHPKKMFVETFDDSTMFPIEILTISPLPGSIGLLEVTPDGNLTDDIYSRSDNSR